MELKPIDTSIDPADVAADLRALADLVENDSDGFLAALLARLINDTSTWPAHAVAYDYDRDKAGIMAEAIRRFKPVATGPIRKDYSSRGDGYLDVTVPLRALSIHLTELRAQVCTRVVTSVEEVTEEVPDPEYVAAAPMVSQTREVETVRWQCMPLLAADRDVAAVSEG